MHAWANAPYAFKPKRHLLARSVFVVDKNDIVRYVQFVSPVGSEPDYTAALAAAKAIL